MANVVLITVDCCRRDVFECYGAKSGLAPFVNSLQTKCVIFRNAHWDEVKGYFNESLFKTVIPRNVRLSEAPSYGKPALLYDISGVAACVCQE